MNNRPYAAELLNIARETLKSLINDLPKDKQYDALMVLNAMAVASRETTNTNDANRESKDFEKIYEVGGREESSLFEFNRRLGSDIRNNKFDGDREVYNFLIENVTRKLQVSNPKYLEGFI